ncbi:MAG: DsrE family protein [Actinobacteria bacterium]|nr:DsrE family protein [Actinomycetota bacterium]
MTIAREILIHAFDEDPAVVAGALRVGRNAAQALPDIIVQVVVQGIAVTGVTTDGGFDEDIAETLARGVRVVACGNSMHRAHVEPSQIAPGVDVVPSAVAHLAERQWAGAAYVRV